MLGASVQLDGSLDIEDGILAAETKDTMNQWSFLVPLIGGRYHIIPQLAVYTTYIPYYIAYWVIIYQLPPIKGTRKNYWMNTRIYSHRNQRWNPSEKRPSHCPQKKMSIFQPSIFKGHHHFSLVPHTNCSMLFSWEMTLNNKSCSPWKINGWFTYSHHPWKERNIIFNKNLHDVDVPAVHLVRGGSPPLFPTCCLCNPWLWCSKRHRCYPQWSQPGKR